ncbi:hypothetical protein KC338_g9113 [Hortaea werneckii]|nr:hypothetical protein KC338_g9113 [Hortaea werneckii]
MSATAAAAGPFPSHGLVRSDSGPHDSAVAQATAVAALQDATTAPTSATGSASPPADVPGGAIKNAIESLERRIKELESQQPFQELQRAIQDRDRAIQEAYDLRQKLSDITRVINGQGPSHAYPSSGHIIISSSITNSSSNNRDHLMATSGADGYGAPSQEAGSHHQRQASQQNLGKPSPASHPTTQGSLVSHSATAGADAAQNYHPQQHYTSQPNGGAQKDARSTPQRSLQHQNSAIGSVLASFLTKDRTKISEALLAHLRTYRHTLAFHPLRTHMSSRLAAG